MEPVIVKQTMFAYGREFMKRRQRLVYWTAIVSFTLWLFLPYFADLYKIWLGDLKNTLGYFAPFVSLWALFLKREEIKSTRVHYSTKGWPFFAIGLGLAILFRWSEQALFAALAFPVYLFGLCLIIWGRERTRYLIFPIFILLFLYPWGDLLNSIAGFHLRRISVLMTFLIFITMGMEAAVSGTFLFTGRFLVDVAPACSGLAMMNVLLFMGAIGVHLYEDKWSKKVLLFVSVIPLSIILNTLRVALTGLIGHFFGEEKAMGFYHDVSGMLVFGLAMLILYIEAELFKRLKGLNDA